MAEVKLYGFWSSPYNFRVIWALKLKGIDYEYIEEDVRNNKSEDLLKYNPVHKKIPVLVHNGNPVAESQVILEYIEETWPENYQLLSKDPYDRAMARFWMQYFDGFLQGPKLSAWFASSTEEEKEKTEEEVLEILKMIEEKALGDKKFFGGDSLSVVDLAFGVFGLWFKAMQEVVGSKLMEESKVPKLYAWAQNFQQVPQIKENSPDYDKLLPYVRNVQEIFFKK